MTHFISLVKNVFRSSFRLAKKQDSAKRAGKLVRGIALVALLALVIFAVMFAPMGAMLGETAKQSGGIFIETFVVVCIVFSVLLLIFSLFQFISIMYSSKDTEFLLSMPIKNSTIYLARMFSIYIMLAVASLLFLCTFGVPFGIVAGMPIGFYFLFPILALVMPIPVLFVSTFLSLPLNYLITFIKKNRIVTTLFLFMAAAAFIAFYVWMFSNTAMFDSTNSEESIVMPAEVVLVFKNIAKYAYCFTPLLNILYGIGNMFVELMIFVGVNAIILLAMVGISVLVYRRGLSKGLEISAERFGGGIESIKQSSPKKALILKEIKTLFRTPMFLWTVLMQIALPIIMVMIFSSRFFGGASDATVEPTLKYVLNLIPFITIILFGMMFSCGMNYVASSSISREGKQFYLMKIMPVSLKEQIEIKAKISLAIPLFSILILCIVSMFRGVSILDGLLLIPFFALCAYGFNYWQIASDMKNPKLNWDNPSQIMQNNPNMIKVTFIGMAIAILMAVGVCVIGFLSFFLPIIVVQIITWVVLYAVAFLIAFLCRRSFLNKFYIYFDQIQN